MSRKGQRKNAKPATQRLQTALCERESIQTVQSAKDELKLGGRNLATILFDSCKITPFKELIEKLTEIENGAPTEEKMKQILEYQDEDNGDNCLIACYETLRKDKSKGIEWKLAIEQTIKFLIVKASVNGVDTTKVINHVTKKGTTLFRLSAGGLSENVARFLIQRNVEVNEIDVLFQPVNFMVNYNFSYYK